MAKRPIISAGPRRGNATVANRLEQAASGGLNRIMGEASLATASDAESAADPSPAEVERTMLIRALTKASWNQTLASQFLNISRDSLRYKMKKFGLAQRRH